MENLVNMSFGNSYRGKKVLLTGHTGFKGSWLAIWLRELGAEVYGYALAPYSDMDNFVSCNLETHIHHREGDVRDGNHLKSYFQEVQPDIAFHLAAQPLVLLSYKDPVGTFDTNLMGVVHFFEAVRATPSVKVAINVTSDKCYDNKEWVWGYRENDPMGGKDPYSASKGCAELITAAYLQSYFQADDATCLVASARAGNVIGGGDWAENRIVPDFYRALMQGDKLEVRNPHATRPWQHVLEPLSGYLHLGAALLTHGRTYSGGWNFGPEDTANYSVKELIDQMLAYDAKGGYSTPELTNKPHEATLLKLDISKAVNRLAWRPALSFLETVTFTVDGYNEQLDGKDMLASRIRQIEAYTSSAKAKNISWAD